MGLAIIKTDKEVRSNGDIAVTLQFTGATVVKMGRSGQPKLQPHRRLQGKARALAEAGIIEQRDYIQLIQDNALSGNILSGRKELVDVENVREIQTGDVKNPYVKEKALATFVIDSNVDPE